MQGERFDQKFSEISQSSYPELGFEGDTGVSTFPLHYPTCPWSQSKQTSPSHNTSPNQPLAGILGATATRDQHNPIWSPNLSPSNHGSQQQAVSTAYDGLYPPVHSNAITNGQPDPTLQLPNFGVYNDFGVVPNGFANFNSFTQWDDLTSIDLKRP
ncbi:hypothetical protein V8E51_002405 [Hyaloscypha variabilis]